MTRTAGELAQYLGAKLDGDSRARISGLASPELASAGDLIYIDSPRQKDRAANSPALCVIAKPGVVLTGKTVLQVNEPKLAFAKTADWLLPKQSFAPMIHPTAIVSPRAKVGTGVFVGPYAVIEEETEIGSNSVIEAFCCLGRGSHVGKNCRLHPRVTLYAGSRVGDRVEIHSGAVLGGDGFGYVFGEGRHWKFPQIGTLEIGDDVEIGSNTTIDRGALGVTRVGAGTKIDNLVQVAHNVEIGEHSIVAAQTGISGSSTLGKNVMLGGQAGLADHCIIEDGAIVGAQAGVLPGKTIRAGHVVWGTPARSLKKFKEQYAWSARVPELAERIRKLEENAGTGDNAGPESATE
jgi:UDP-3-O-[3-hydroxymyristoyl] glucosamine N-acyltransferase